MNNRTQIPQAIPPLRPIRSQYPELPSKLSKAFPEFKDYHDENERNYRSLLTALRSFSDSINLPEVKTDLGNTNKQVTQLKSVVDDMSASITVILSTYASKDYAEAKKSEAITASSAYADGQIAGLSTVYATKTEVSSTVASQIAASLTSTDSGTIGGAISGLSSVYATTSSVASAVASQITASLESSSAGTIGGAINGLSSVYATPTYVNTTVATQVAAAVSGKTTVYVQGTAPSSPATGDLWIDTASGNAIKRWSGSAWGDYTPAGSGASKNATFVQSTAPTATKTGDLWVDTSSGNKLKYWNGSSWVDSNVASGAITSALSAYATQTYADTKKTEAISASNGYTDSAITTEANARATADGYLTSKYTLSVNASGVITGFTALSSTQPNGSTISTFDITAGIFRIWTSGGMKNPFTVSGSTVYMDNVTVRGTLDVGTGIDRATITNSQLSQGYFSVTPYGGSSTGLQLGSGSAAYIQMYGMGSGGTATIALYPPGGSSSVYIQSTGQATFSSTVGVGNLVASTTISATGQISGGSFSTTGTLSAGAATLTGNLSMASYDAAIRYATVTELKSAVSDGWSAKMNTGSNGISFKLDGANLKVRIDATERTVSTS